MKGGRRRIDRITDPSYLEGLGARPLPDVRERRAECQEEEAILSYERRLLHARLDIMRDELERRVGGGEATPLVDRLRRILTDEHRSSRGSFPVDVPLNLAEQPKRRVEKLISDDTLARLPDLSEEEIRTFIEAIEEVERQVSDERRRVQDVQDALNAELMRRYRSGEADPTEALAGS